MSVQDETGTTQESVSAETSAPAVSTPAAPVTSPAPVAAAPTPDATVGNGKNLVLPRDAFNARLKAATEKGKRAALAELEAKIQASGFSSFEDMLSNIAQAKAQTNAKPSEVSQPKKPDDKRSAKELERERQAREQERVSRMKAEKRAKQLEAEYAALQAEKEIREVAIMAGVKDVDYAVELLHRSVRGKSPEELKEFDEQKFFESLKEKQPYLFGETVRPVTTGTGGKEPPAPTPGTVHKSSASNGQTDAKKMNRQEFDAHIQKMGLRPPSHIV